MRPPFHLTPKILQLVEQISTLLGRLHGLRVPTPQPQLRRANRIKSIQGSLAIEGNSLNLDQVSDVFDGKRVLGPKRDVLEVRNAIRLYELIHRLEATDAKDLMRAHRVLLNELDPKAGRFRSGAVGILKGSKVSHVAPSAKMVPKLVDDLFGFLKRDKVLSPLVKACVFHYEFEFIHPFADGNGRLGRFWQSLILTKFHPTFEFTPIESLIKTRQKQYYEALESSDKSGHSTTFIEFSLLAIRDALDDFASKIKIEPVTPDSRLKSAQDFFGKRDFSRKDYLGFFKGLSTASASRDLTLGVREKILSRSGSKATTRYRYK